MPSIDYLFDEAARFRGYKNFEWNRESWRGKARVLAHFLEHNIRESYAMEQARADAKKTQPDGKDTTNWKRFRQGR